MSYVYAVIIENLRLDTVEVVRVFTQRADAETFVATCCGDRDWFDYHVTKVELDGDPKGTI